MEKKQAKEKMTEYLKAHNIDYESSAGKEKPEITMTFREEKAPDRCVESCIWFYEDGAEVRAYYSALGAEICKKSDHKNELLQLLNFINARVFLSCGDPDGLYKSHMLYTPRIYMTEDDRFDITITTMIDYDFWEVAPVETADYITIYCPELLGKLSYTIFSVLLGKIGIDKAKNIINNDVLKG